MIRKLAFAAVVLLAVSLTSCMCTAEKAAIPQLQASHDLITKKFMAYVKADAAAQVAAGKMTSAQGAAFVDDFQKLVDSDQRNIDALKMSLGN